MLYYPNTDLKKSRGIGTCVRLNTLGGGDIVNIQRMTNGNDNNKSIRKRKDTFFLKHLIEKPYT